MILNYGLSATIIDAAGTIRVNGLGADSIDISLYLLSELNRISHGSTGLVALQEAIDRKIGHGHIRVVTSPDFPDRCTVGNKLHSMAGSSICIDCWLVFARLDDLKEWKQDIIERVATVAAGYW